MSDLDQANAIGAAILGLLRGYKREALEDIADLRESHRHVHEELLRHLERHDEMLQRVSEKLAGVECQLRSIMAVVPDPPEPDEIDSCGTYVTG